MRGILPIRWGGADIVALPATLSATSFTVTSPTAVAQFVLANTGKYRRTNGNNVVVDAGDWVLPNGAASNYECMYTLDSGSLTANPGTAGTWLGLETTRTWTRNGPGGGGLQTAVITVHIRKKGTTQTLTSCQVTLSAETSGA